MIRLQAILALSTVAVLTACNNLNSAGLNPLSAFNGSTAGQDESRGKFWGHKQGEEGGFRGMPGLAMLKDLDLTQEQKDKFKALFKANRPANLNRDTMKATFENAKKQMDVIKGLLKAESFDAVAFKAALEAMPKLPEMKNNHLELLKQGRDILTAEQRAKLVEKLKAAPAMDPSTMMEKKMPADKMLGDLNLTDAQKALFEAIKPGGDRPDHSKRRAAMISFIESGNTAELEALKPAARQLPIDAMVAFVSSLDAGQRAKIADKPFGFGGHGRRGHGGPGMGR
jgi:Spy/CpxP family protein refolding chaperone